MTAVTTINELLFGAPPPRARQTAKSERLRRAFADADLAAIYLVARVKFYAMLAVSLYLVTQFLDIWVLYWIAFPAAIGIGGVVHYRLEAAGRRRWYRYAFAMFDILVLTAALAIPNPGLYDGSVPQQMSMRFNAGTYYFVFVALAVLTYSPRFVAWVGGLSAMCWAVVAVYYVFLPSTVTMLDIPNSPSASQAEKFIFSLQANFISISNVIQDVVMILLVTAIGAIAVARTNGLIGRQLTAERERANLSRYFSPNLVDELADMDKPLGAGRRQQAAILFADIVGFTSAAEKLSPDETLTLLREFHGKMAGAIFRHGGTVDKYIGDAVMATFGTPVESDQDGINALRCAEAMLREVETWNDTRRRNGQFEVQIGIGIHHGPVVVGDIGNERRLEFAVLGDTVNTASRIEALTRNVDEAVLVSSELAQKARTEASASDDALLGRLATAGAITVRGRTSETELWVLRSEPNTFN